MPTLIEIAQMVAEAHVVAEYGPDAHVEHFQVDLVEADGPLDAMDARVKASALVRRRVDAVNVTVVVE